MEMQKAACGTRSHRRRCARSTARFLCWGGGRYTADAGVGARSAQSWHLRRSDRTALSRVSRRRRVVTAGGVYRGPSTAVRHRRDYTSKVSDLHHTGMQRQRNHPAPFCTPCPPPCSNLKHHKGLPLLILDHMLPHQELMRAPSQTVRMLPQALYLPTLLQQFSTLRVMVFRVLKRRLLIIEYHGRIALAMPGDCHSRHCPGRARTGSWPRRGLAC
jgi:hypothetical protein